MAAHALLSPSAAHRWLNCTAAPRLERDIDDKGSDFAAEGTLAHAYCAKKLKEFMGYPVLSEDDEIEALAKYHTGEMDEYTDTYKTIVLEKYNAAKGLTKDAELLVETRLDFSDYIPDAFGTSDAIIIADGLMEVIDFKYGKGIKVSAVENPQMLIYALGAYIRYFFEYNIERIRMTIIQPRIDNLSEYEISVSELIKWADTELREKAKEAYSTNGTQKPGEWCQFCKVKTTCKALAERCHEIVEEVKDPKLLNTEEMAIVLQNLPIVKMWYAGIEEYALQQALSGVQYPGWKIVEGRSIRKIVSQPSAAQALYRAGFKADDIYKPMELRNITDLEKLAGKKRFAELCSDFIDKPQGKPTLVPESDKRQAIDPVADDFKNVDITNQ